VANIAAVTAVVVEDLDLMASVAEDKQLCAKL